MSLTVSLKVVPSSGRNAWILDKSGELKCYLKNPPEKGKANKELIALFAQALDIPKSEVEIIGGLTSRKKRIKINLDISFDTLVQNLGIEQQQKLFK